MLFFGYDSFEIVDFRLSIIPWKATLLNEPVFLYVLRLLANCFCFLAWRWICEAIGKERSVYGVSIKVLSASIDPKRVCEVEIN